MDAANRAPTNRRHGSFVHALCVGQVVANAMAALTEIANTSDEEIHMDFTLVNKLLAAVNESSEYGRPPALRRCTQCAGRGSHRRPRSLSPFFCPLPQVGPGVPAGGAVHVQAGRRERGRDHCGAHGAAPHARQLGGDAGRRSRALAAAPSLNKAPLPMRAHSRPLPRPRECDGPQLIMHVMPYFSREEVRKAYARKLSPPLGAERVHVSAPSHCPR